MARSLLPVVVSACLALLTPQADAYSSWQSEMPNGGNVQRNGASWPAVGHTTSIGGGKNQFGLDFKAAGGTWTTAVCQMDSDGDGYSNGLELGDPECTWAKGDTPSRTHTISHPGFADSFPVFAPPTPAPSTDAPATPQPPASTATPVPTQSVTNPPATDATDAATTPAPDFAAKIENVTAATTSEAKSVLGGKFSLSWSIDVNTSDLIIHFTSTGDHYVALGVSPSQMNGPMITCYVSPAGEAKCSDWEGSGLSLGSPASYSSIVSSSRNPSDAGYNITVRASLAKLNVQAWAAQRVIYAVGSYDIASNTPYKHIGADRSEDQVNFYSVLTLANGTTPAQAPAVTAAPSTNITLPMGATEQLTSRTFSSEEGIEYKWKVLGNGDSATDVIEMTLAVDEDQYAAFGVSPSQMNGPLVACYVSEENGVAVPYCSDWIGSGLSISPAPTPRTEIVSARRTGDGSRRQAGSNAGYEVTIRYRASDLNIEQSSQRVIFATGSYSTISNTPSQHSRSDRSAARINFYSGAVEDAGTKEGFYIALIVILSVCFVILVIAAVLNFAKIVFRPTASKVLRVSLVFVFIGFLVLYFVMNLRDYNRSGRSLAVQRAIGDCAVLAFWFVLWPTPKHIGITTVVGASWERLLNYHIVVGMATFVFTTFHFIGMAAKLKGKGLFERDGPHPTLPGFVAWVLTVILVLSSLFLRRKFYAVFRMMHWLFIPLIIAACMHYNKLVWAFLPPLVNLMVDWCVRLYRHVSTDAHLVSATPIPEAKTTMLRIGVAPDAKLPSNGEYVMLSLEGARFMHPYTVAWIDTETTPKRPELIVMVKSMGEGTWSNKVFEMASAGTLKTGSKVWMTGPYGSLQVPLDSSQDHLVLVCGGIGVTPMLGLLQQIANTPTLKPKSVTVVWSLRDLAIADVLRGFFGVAREAIRARGIEVNIQLYSSVPHADADCIKSPFVFHKNRPNINDVLEGLGADTCDQDALDTAAVYVCGPQSLMDDAEAAASRRPNTVFHSELFEF